MKYIIRKVIFDNKEGYYIDKEDKHFVYVVAFCSSLNEAKLYIKKIVG